MGIPDPTDPGNGPALPDTPPYLPVGTLAARLADLLGQADGLAMPWLATVDEPSQMLALEFGRARQSINDVVAWAFRFGGTIMSHPCEVLGEPTQHVTTSFEFGGVTVSAFAFISYDGQEDDFNDDRY
jgi:hypothetical protein